MAEKWLVSRLIGQARVQGGRLDLRVEPDPADFALQSMDLRLAYDPSHYPEQAVVPLEQDAVLPLCIPACLDRNPAAREKGMTGVPGKDLWHTSWGPASAPFILMSAETTRPGDDALRWIFRPYLPWAIHWSAIF